MNKKSKWLLVVSMVTIIASSGIVMASSTIDNQEKPEMKKNGSVNPTHGHRGSGEHKNFKRDNTALLELLKIDEATFKSELAAGKTLAGIAAEQGVQKQELVDLIVKQMSERIDVGVKAGRITDEKANQMKDNLAKHAEKMIEKGKNEIRKSDLSPLTALLKIDDQTLRSEFKNGKSLVDIALEHGVSKQELMDVCTQMVSNRLDAQASNSFKK